MTSKPPQKEVRSLIFLNVRPSSAPNAICAVSYSVRMASQVESSHIGRQSKSEQRLEASLAKALEKIKQLENENDTLRKQFTVAGERSAVGSTKEAWKVERDSYVSRTLLAEQELKLVKALLLLQNVDVKVNVIT